MVTPTQINDALAGRRGPVAQRFLAHHVTRSGSFLGDLTQAMLPGGDLRVDNSRAVITTAQVEFLLSGMPASLDHIKLIEERRIEGLWVQFPLGVFAALLDSVSYATDGQPRARFTLQDLTAHLVASKTAEPYTVAASTNYVTALETLLDLFSLPHSLPASSAATPVAHAWAPGTTHVEILNDLAHGVNLYPPWPQPSGVFTTRTRVDPRTETPDRTYRDTDEPRLISTSAPYVRSANRATAENRCVVVIDDPRHPDYGFVTRENADPASPVSTANRDQDLLVINADSDISTKAILDTATATAIAEFELIIRAGEAITATLSTVPDPERGPRERYLLDVAGVESLTRWRVRSWRRRLDVGAPMQHELTSAPSVTISPV